MRTLHKDIVLIGGEEMTSLVRKGVKKKRWTILTRAHATQFHPSCQRACDAARCKSIGELGLLNLVHGRQPRYCSFKQLIPRLQAKASKHK